mgnify:CR=1 FL=1
MKIISQGQNKRRIELNAKRLLSDIYTYPKVFMQENNEWKGDWEGRALLAMCSLYRVTEGDYREALLAQIKTYMVHLPEHINSNGYFGPLFDKNCINEQQLSGNSWYIRGLCEYFSVFSDQYVFDLIKTISDNFLCEIGQYILDYPIVKREVGGVGGHLGKDNYRNWMLSSDVGCAFILLDGITAAYKVYPNEKLRVSIENMIHQYSQLDFEGLSVQTHATLSGARGIMRYFTITKDVKYLEIVKKIFKLYLDKGMTVNYANYNWFGKPYWTEPCAVVDSLILAEQLYLYTLDVEYIRLFNRIYFNALASGQRQNGGAGCETCLTEKSGEMRMHLYEAFFCCTMRLAEGLAAVNDFLVIREKNGLFFPLLDSLAFSDELCSGEIRVSGETDTDIDIDFDFLFEGSKTIRLYIPESAQIQCDFPYVRNGDIMSFEAVKGHWSLRYILQEKTEQRMGHAVHFLGDKLLSCKNDEKKYTLIANSIELSEEEVNSLTQKFW